MFESFQLLCMLCSCNAFVTLLLQRLLTPSLQAAQSHCTSNSCIFGILVVCFLFAMLVTGWHSIVQVLHDRVDVLAKEASAAKEAAERDPDRLTLTSQKGELDSVRPRVLQGVTASHTLLRNVLLDIWSKLEKPILLEDPELKATPWR